MNKITSLDMYIYLMKDIYIYDNYAMGRQMKNLFFLFYPELKPQMINDKKHFADNFEVYFQYFMLGFIPIEAIGFTHNYPVKMLLIDNRTIVLINCGFGFINKFRDEFKATSGDREMTEKYFRSVLFDEKSNKNDLKQAYVYKSRARNNAVDLMNIQEVN